MATSMISNDNGTLDWTLPWPPIFFYTPPYPQIHFSLCTALCSDVVIIPCRRFLQRTPFRLPYHISQTAPLSYSSFWGYSRYPSCRPSLWMITYNARLACPLSHLMVWGIRVGFCWITFSHEHILDYIHPSVEKASMITYSITHANTYMIYALEKAGLAFGRYVLVIECFSSICFEGGMPRW